MTEYRHNHYVPVWYQRRFLPPGQKNQELQYLHLRPEVFVDRRGGRHQGRAVHQLGFKHCFAEDDLYTSTFGGVESTQIEEVFFGSVDSRGRNAVEYFASFAHPSVNGDAYNALLLYMTTQKLRTPKGLAWLSEQAGTTDKNRILEGLMFLRQLYGAIWTECVWQIADASQSGTKLIVSDHPVTVYNRRCGPRSQWCRGNNDPDIRFHGTHTIFPLSLEKVLLFTNLSWVRNPYQSPTGLRPNPTFYRPAMFNFTQIQTLRQLSEQEVRQINFIIKSRARSYVAAAREEWLYPERDVQKSEWSTYGDGYLFMPDPRALHLGGEIMWGNEDGSRVGAIDAYGRRPGQRDFGREGRTLEEWKSLQRFKAEFARIHGPSRRGRAFGFGALDPETDSDELHQLHLRHGPRSR